jgi:hypothetical protein
MTEGFVLGEERNSWRMTVALRRMATKEVMVKERRTWGGLSVVPVLVYRGR